MDRDAPPPPDRRAEARRLLRQWLAGGEGDASGSIAAIGARAIRAASGAVGRLDRLPSAAAAERTLAHLEELASGFADPPPARTPFAFLRGPRIAADPRPKIQRIVEDLERESDEIARAALTIAGDGKRLREAAAELEDAVALLHACTAAVAAAARELPERAGFLETVVGPLLLERERDVATQAAVTAQAILTLQLVADGQEALGRALARARDTSIAALRTAIAARSATAAQARLQGQADAIDVRHALDQAIDEARRGTKRDATP